MLNKLKIAAVAALMAAASALLPASVPVAGSIIAYSVMAGFTPEAQAQTANYAPQVPVVVIPVRVASAGASVTSAARFRMPFQSRLIGVSAAARSGTGTAPTLTADVLVNSVSLLTAPVSITAGAAVQASIATPAIADEANVTVNLAVGGTTPLWQDVDILLTFVRR